MPPRKPKPTLAQHRDRGNMPLPTQSDEGHAFAACLSAHCACASAKRYVAGAGARGAETLPMKRPDRLPSGKSKNITWDLGPQRAGKPVNPLQ